MTTSLLESCNKLLATQVLDVLHDAVAPIEGRNGLASKCRSVIVNSTHLEAMNMDNYAFSHLAHPDEATPDCFPELSHISSRFIYRLLPVPDGDLIPPEYVYLPSTDGCDSRTALRMADSIAMWNVAWEASRFNWQVHNQREFPKRLRWLFSFAREKNVRLVSNRTKDRYHAYAPLYHLLPRRTLERFGLPLLRRGLWPPSMPLRARDRELPTDFDERLAAAFSFHIWPFVSPGIIASAFSAREDPVRILCHNLDFWLPYIDLVAQRRIRANGRTEPENPEDVALMAKINAANPDAGGSVVPPCYGGAVWMGEEDAKDATRELVLAADQHGKLSALIEAVRSHRVQDDFSSRWSYAREDFERKLHHKRMKIRPTFVELRDTIPVHGPESEVHEQMLWQDFLMLVNPKDRRIVVCLRSGLSGAVEISRALGYANHTPVSKALARIRLKAMQFFNLN